MSTLALEEHECTVYETKGDWWADSILGKQQLPGIFEVTNKRFAFRGKTLLGTAKENGLEFDPSDLASVEKCNIGNGIVKIIPTGLRLTMRDGGQYVVSILKRDKLLEILENAIR